MNSYLKDKMNNAGIVIGTNDPLQGRRINATINTNFPFYYVK